MSRAKTGENLWRAATKTCVAALLGFVLAPPTIVWAWGARTHEIINRRAVDALPEDSRAAWRLLAQGLGAHASDADHRKSVSRTEPGRHFIDIDVYDSPPFAKVPRDRTALEKKKGVETVARWGTVPWAIEECYLGVIESLRRQDWSSAGAWAADLGHYVGDSHQPLHCTKNYDGQNTGNKGIHLRFEVTMMDRSFDEARHVTLEPLVIGEEPRSESVKLGLLGRPVDATFAWIPEAYAGIEPLLAADTAARAQDSQVGDVYYAVLWEKTEELAVRQVNAAILDLSALLHSAWVAAGSPPGPPESPEFLVSIPPKDADPENGPRSVSLRVLAAATGVFLLSWAAGSL